MNGARLRLVDSESETRSIGRVDTHVDGVYSFGMIRFVLAALFAVVATGALADASMLKRGRAIAAQNCGRCHAIGLKGESANPKSPPFRTLAKRYPLSNLEEALGEGIVVGHEGTEMPQFKLSTAQIEALLAYLNSIQR